MRQLSIVLSDSNTKPFSTLSDDLIMEGVTRAEIQPGTQTLIVNYSDEFITAQMILDKLSELGFEHADIIDEELK